MRDLSVAFEAFSFYILPEAEQAAAPDPPSPDAADQPPLRVIHYFLHPPPLGFQNQRLETTSAEFQALHRSTPHMWQDPQAAEPLWYFTVPLVRSVATLALPRPEPLTEDERAAFTYLASAFESLLQRHRSLVLLAQAHEQQERLNQQLQQLRLTTQSHRVDADLIALHDGSYDLFGPTQDEVGRKIIDLITDKLNFDRAGVFLIEEDGQALRGLWGVDDDGQTVPIASTRLPLAPQNPAELSELAQVALGRLDYFLTQNLDEQSRRSLEGNIKANAAVPMRVGNRIIGAIAVDNYFSDRPISDNALYSLRILANQGAAAIDNARNYQTVQEGRQQLQHLSKRLVEMQEETRRFIARELHDEIGQHLTGLNLLMTVAAGQAPAAIAAQLDEAQRIANDLTARVRDLSLDLRPTMLDDQGLVAALTWHIRRYTLQTGVQVQFSQSISDRRFNPAAETAVFRIVQEALTNVARHAHIDRVQVTLAAGDDALEARIADNGCGFSPAEASTRYTSGLTGIRERLDALGGALDLQSAPGQGTCLTARLPLDSPDKP